MGDEKASGPLSSVTIVDPLQTDTGKGLFLDKGDRTLSSSML